MSTSANNHASATPNPSSAVHDTNTRSALETSDSYPTFVFTLADRQIPRSVNLVRRHWIRYEHGGETISHGVRM